ncbi:MAG TPA: type 4a pilus biogenesis protein PilO, partial [Steroidobacteraceae bacterium]
DPGRWPLPFRAGAVAVWFLLLTLALSYVFVWQNQRPELQRRESEEQDLREQFRTKHAKAINLEAYKQQLADIERSFGALLRQLPGKTEVPNLLVDISQTGLAAGLQEKLFTPAPEEKKDFYAELPIKIRLSGSYHQFGEFVSGIAALPRIVTLHNLEIKPDAKDAYDQLTLDVTAKTYRYLDEDEIASAEAEKRKQDKAHHPTVGSGS